MKNIGIYVHIPFCKQKCAYCDFCSFCANDKIVERYFNFLNSEIKRRALADAKVQSIYFGGGTPSSIDERYIVSILDTIKDSFYVDANAEITIECNPCSTSENKLVAYRNAGFNRVSFGVQSFNDEILKMIGRLHNSREAEKAINCAKIVGFRNISCDLMIGLPKQTKEDLIFAIDKLNDLGVKHISSYMLQLEEGTILYDKVQKGELKVLNEDEQVELYESVIDQLNKLGFKQYEVSNFAKESLYSRHNINYWRRGEYLGFGLSAHSFIDETRFANSNNMKEYENGKFALIESLSKEEIAEEIVMLGLRYFEGVDLEALRKINGKIATKIKESDYVNAGIIKIKKGKAILDPKYYEINNEIIVNLIWVLVLTPALFCDKLTKAKEGDKNGTNKNYSARCRVS